MFVLVRNAIRKVSKHDLHVEMISYSWNGFQVIKPGLMYSVGDHSFFYLVVLLIRIQCHPRLNGAIFSHILDAVQPGGRRELTEEEKLLCF